MQREVAQRAARLRAPRREEARRERIGRDEVPVAPFARWRNGRVCRLAVQQADPKKRLPSASRTCERRTAARRPPPRRSARARRAPRRRGARRRATRRPSREALATRLPARAARAPGRRCPTSSARARGALRRGRGAAGPGRGRTSGERASPRRGTRRRRASLNCVADATSFSPIFQLGYGVGRRVSETRRIERETSVKPYAAITWAPSTLSGNENSSYGLPIEYRHVSARFCTSRLRSAFITCASGTRNDAPSASRERQ